MIDDDYIALCREEAAVISAASIVLLNEQLVADDNDISWTQQQIDRRRAELYREYLDAAGIELRRK